ncbi:tubulin polyglutamylase complex subunit 2 isoform X2 [Zootermopsis nevadensis]|uniref:tubulin polyglutamylase complex subunit 2 isoform X2 n=1 Tax=Zootermopsis nevadensis TaxID=136037 RepID=UPI000B8E801A|nr:tubulin polyglutamylase complex subunit 2 isoform X2 [Zootermopsis nevadensis]
MCLGYLWSLGVVKVGEATWKFCRERAESWESTPGIREVELEKRLPCERMLLTAWEQRHCCTLPEDMRHFYLSTDGFKLIWNYEYAGEVLPVGHMKINSVSELRRLAGVKNTGDADYPTLLDIEVCSQQDVSNPARQRPSFGVKCKIFEIDSCQGIGKVCLVYADKSDCESDLKREDPKIWLLDRSFQWHFLAEGFTQYFRMLLIHQGLPQWQFKFTPMGLTPWAEQMFVLIAPHLLQSSLMTQSMDWSDMPCNHLDPAIFKTRGKSSKKKVDTAKSRPS